VTAVGPTHAEWSPPCAPADGFSSVLFRGARAQLPPPPPLHFGLPPGAPTARDRAVVRSEEQL